MRRATLLAIILTVILSPPTSASEVSFSSPSSIVVMESFDVDISIPNAETYDVKIFFKQSADTLSSEIQTQEGWKNAYYYLKSSFPTQHVYTVRLKQTISQDSDASICVRLRKPNQTTYEENCKDISIVLDTSEAQTNTESPEETKNKDNNNYNAMPFESSTNSDPNILSQSEKVEDNEPIFLRNSLESQTETLSRQAKVRIGINYALAIIILIALFLIARRHNREF